ncbi:unnamed protein product [Psylliodes chrysocephalus]|uniref:Attacin C-terminal domain-containing protein n=1 Tax=Psylliodes chrysocephalus TaxID=3402493 RepID=A0A9P0D3V8_9CUCU|nr:unnamed protein product [Psylliodes chrysocephala]
METLIAFAVFVAVATALPLNVFEDENGQDFVLVPVHRQRREVTWGANQGGYALGQKGTVFSNDNHRVDGSYGASKTWGSHGLKPDSFGGQVDYTHKPTGSTGFVGVNRTPGWGNDVNAGVKYNIAQGKNWGADVTGQEVTWGANQGGYALGQKGTVFSNDNHRVDGSYGASKAWGSHGVKPDSFGGQVDYTHKPSGSTGFVGVNRTPGWGNDVSAGAKYNIAQGKNWGADVTGQYGRHFGGPGGTGKPQGGVFLNVGGKF